MSVQIFRVNRLYYITGGYSCNFENGYCNYTQSKTDVFDWTRSYGQSQSSGTGPNNDHTYGTPRGIENFCTH